MPSLTYSGQIIRQQDPDRFLLSLLVPAGRRADLWALFAFNHEIAKTREVVTDATIGKIRLQWWRDAIGEIYSGGAVRSHPVLVDLTKSVQKYGLEPAHFDTLITAREFDLEKRNPGTSDEWFAYLEQTSAPLNQLILQVLGREENYEVVRSASVNYSLVGQMRAVPYYLSQGRCLLPSDILGQHGLNVQKIIDFNETHHLPEVMKEILGRFLPFQDVHSRYLKGTRRLVTLYQKQIEQVGYDVFHPRMQVPPRFKALRVALNF